MKKSKQQWGPMKQHEVTNICSLGATEGTEKEKTKKK
jgi:hypothetical protein